MGCVLRSRPCVPPPTTWAVLLGASLALACHPHSVPAVVLHSTAESRAELTRVVRAALNGAPVRLAEDSIADGTLIIQRAIRRDTEGRPLNGRDTVSPERFQLVRRGSRCVLVHERTRRIYPLGATTCAPR